MSQYEDDEDDAWMEGDYLAELVAAGKLTDRGVLAYFAGDRWSYLRQHIDNPANEDRWSDAKAIADRAEWPRRGMSATLDSLQRAGLVESMREDYTPSPRSDPPPRLWRRRLEPGA